MQLLSLQVLRAFAAWVVFAHHYMQVFHDFQSSNMVGYFFSAYGAFGVDVFFVLSGFIMVCSITMKNKTSFEFFVGRLLRITPAYWSATILVVIAAALFPLEIGEELGVTKKALATSLFYIPYPDPVRSSWAPILSVGWTLQFEMFFYWSIFVSLLMSGRFWFIPCATALLVLPVIWPEDLYFSIIAGSKLLWEFVVGMILGFFYLNLSWLRVSRRISFVPVYLACSFFLLAKGGAAAGGYFVTERLIAASLVLWGALCLESWTPRHWASQFLVRLGEASYSTYLVHVPILLVLAALIPNPTTLGTETISLAISIVCTWMLSEVFRRHIELSPVVESFRARLLSLRIPNQPQE